MEHEYLAVGPCCWGRGDTVKEAVKNMRANWSRIYAGSYSKKKVRVVTVAKGCWVNEMGGVSWKDDTVDHNPRECKECFGKVEL